MIAQRRTLRLIFRVAVFCFAIGVAAALCHRPLMAGAAAAYGAGLLAALMVLVIDRGPRPVVSG